MKGQILIINHQSYFYTPQTLAVAEYLVLRTIPRLQSVLVICWITCIIIKHVFVQELIKFLNILDILELSTKYYDFKINNYNNNLGIWEVLGIWKYLCRPGCQ